MKKCIGFLLILLIVLYFATIIMHFANNKEKRIRGNSTKHSNLLETKQVIKVDSINLYKSAKIEVKIISSEKNTFGYDIYLNDKLFIHQPSIPSITGNQGFKTSQNALKAADMVISKIRKNIIPPSLSNEELQKANIIN